MNIPIHRGAILAGLLVVALAAGSASRYPGGQEVSCQHAILDDGMTRGSAGDELDGCGEDRTWPVGSRAANAFGLYDMHGNVGEWLHNWYAPDAPAGFYAGGNLRGPESGMRRLVRGGSWDENRSNLRSSYRNVKPPVSGGAVYGSIGFRCARSLSDLGVRREGKRDRGQMFGRPRRIAVAI